ncbi:MAG TPA: EamA family transporter, partial [Candidatus Limnocylindria bacterium]
VVIGFAGVGLLVVPRGVSGEIAPIGLLFMLLAPASWGWGTFMSKRLAVPRDALASTTLQQVLGGLGLLAAALATGERAEPSTWSDRSLIALAYLVVFGSLVAFSAYTWLLAHVNVSKVSTYAYVNPVVAVLLGALILGEPITPTIVLGGLLVIVAVAFIVRAPEARPPVRSAS